MVSTRKCDHHNLIYNELKCEFAYVPAEHYKWLETTTTTGIICLMNKIEIKAEKADSKLFGTEWKASDLKCQLGDSILVWDKNIIHYCPYNFISTTMNVDIYGEYLLNLEHNSGFKIIENFTNCDESYQNSILFYKTVEGIYLTTNDKIKNLNISEMSETNKNDLLLASIDSLNMIEEINMNIIFSQFCENIKFT